MPSSGLDGLTSPTLKNLREDWWDDQFTAFLTETLKPRPGNRILDVGCGTGTGEVSIGRLRLSQIQLFGIDVVLEKVRVARQATADINRRAHFSVADARRLPFRDGAFDSTYCVAVLQHVGDVEAALAEFARVTRPGGRVVAVEPDNAARYWYSSTESGMRAFEAALRFFSAAAAARRDGGDGTVGPRLATLFAAHGIEPVSVRLFPVSLTRVGPPAATAWEQRRGRAERAVQQAAAAAQPLGREYLAALAAYQADAASAGPSFVEIQNTLLFATVGQRSE